MTRDEIEERANQLLIADLMQMGSILSAGDVIKGYCVIEMIGQGSFGQVFKVSKDERKFALKLCGAGQEGVEEIKFLKRLNGIQQVPDVVESGEFVRGDARFLYFVQKLAPDAKDLLSKAKINRWNLNQKINYFIEFCKVVNQIHAHDIIHSDLKRHNLLLDGNNQPWVIDFGLSSSYRGLPVFPQGRTPLYASPEQLKNEEITSKSDIFTLGVILCQLLVDQIPRKFSSDGRVETKRVGEISANLSDDLVKIIEKCLCEQPRDRYDTMGCLISDLESALGVTMADDTPGDDAADYSGSGDEEPARNDLEKFKELFPLDPKVATRGELSRLLSNGALAQCVREVVEFRGDSASLLEDPFQEMNLDEIFDAIRTRVDKDGLGGLQACLLKEFLGGLLVLAVSSEWTEEERKKVITKAPEIGSPTLDLGEAADQAFARLVIIYQAAIADRLANVDDLFRENEALDLGSPEEVPQGTDASAIKQAALKVLAVKYFKHYDPKKGLNQKKLRELKGGVDRLFKTKGGYYSVHPKWLGILADLEGEPVFERVLFFKTGKDDEQIIPGYFDALLALYDLLEVLKKHQ